MQQHSIAIALGWRLPISIHIPITNFKLIIVIFNFPANNPSPGIDLLQADYSFRKLSQFGGYTNQTFYIIEYTDSYEVKSAGKIQAQIVADSVEENEKNGFEQ